MQLLKGLINLFRGKQKQVSRQAEQIREVARLGQTLVVMELK